MLFKKTLEKQTQKAVPAQRIKVEIIGVIACLWHKTFFVQDIYLHNYIVLYTVLKIYVKLHVEVNHTSLKIVISVFLFCGCVTFVETKYFTLPIM